MNSYYIFVNKIKDNKNNNGEPDRHTIRSLVLTVAKHIEPVLIYFIIYFYYFFYSLLLLLLFFLLIIS